MPSLVAQTPAAQPEELIDHFERRLRYETDCWDVHHALSREKVDCVLLNVRGPAAYAASHIPGAVNLPHGKITARRLSEWPADTLFVVYCAGAHCNAVHKSALGIARLGRPARR